MIKAKAEQNGHVNQVHVGIFHMQIQEKLDRRVYLQPKQILLSERVIRPRSTLTDPDNHLTTPASFKQMRLLGRNQQTPDHPEPVCEAQCLYTPLKQ